LAVGGATHSAVDPRLASVIIAMLRLVTVQVDVVKDATNSIAGLDGLVGFDTTAVPLTALDGFLC
jgi:hypothetical protein